MPPPGCARRAPIRRRSEVQPATSATRSRKGCRGMPIETVEKIWMDGELVDWDDAKIHILTHTLHYGCGVFEGIRAYETSRGAAVFRLRDHMVRLFNSAKIFMIDIPFTVDELIDATR